jgi:Asp-tRNA(Asn)/Glu-tRNA(Gln) amidotransferase A subunit family amidase
MSQRLRDREITASALVEAHIERIQAVNPAINALVTDAFTSAREAAQVADSAFAQHAPISPLQGIPFTLKDCHDTAGVRSTCGLTARRDYIPAADGWVAGKLRALGAILLGKTNLPDNCFSGVAGADRPRRFHGGSATHRRATGGNAGARAHLVNRWGCHPTSTHARLQDAPAMM